MTSIDPTPLETTDTPPTIYGPWTLSDDVLYDNKGVRIVGTTHPDYVLKVRPKDDTAYDELGAFCMIRRHRLNYAVHTPHDSAKFCGMTDTHVWFAIRRYAGCLAYDDFARDNWRRIAQDTLAFLTQLHRSCHLIHMDVKVTNILRTGGRPAFVVADYELCDTPNRRHTRDYRADFRYYYLAMGAELDQPLYSWRMDLTALGYMLAEMTWNKVDNRHTTFQRLMYRRRDAAAAGEAVDPSGDAELVALRESEMRLAHPSVLAYLQHIDKDLTWTCEFPPPETFYRELLSFFV